MFRERRCGVLVNVTLSVTLARMPLASAYTASKAAIEGFTGSLAFEMDWFNVRVKLIEPGYAPSTNIPSNGAYKDCLPKRTPRSRNWPWRHLRTLLR
jgi:NAD(P)-dependent dehydrogenase (short-subunit alcohol dehydrogenase family)